MQDRQTIIWSRYRHRMKCLYWQLRRGATRTTKLFIFGSQRSGTNMMSDAFDRDWSTLSFGEDRGLAIGNSIDGDSPYRWKEYAEVARILSLYRPKLTVAKPIVESQNANQILDFFDGSYGMWMFRNPRDVIASSTKLFGVESTLYNLFSLMTIEQRKHWFRQNVPEEIKEIVEKHFDIRRSIADLKAIGWIVRNQLVFSQGLPSSSSVKFVQYESFVSEPEGVMRSIFDFLLLPYPGNHLLKAVHGDSVRKGRAVQISKEIEQICDDLYGSLSALSNRAT